MLTCVDGRFSKPAGAGDSPPWDIEDKFESSSTVGEVGLHAPAEEDEVGPPPVSQVRPEKAEAAYASGCESVLQSNEAIGGKSTPSTLSDNADEEGVGDHATGKLLGGSGVASKKRIGSKGRDLEEQEASEEGQDVKRKPRKSARLA